MQLNTVMAQERGASSSSRKRARTPSPPAIPSSSTSTDPDEEEEEEEVSDELLPEEQEEVFDSQGHSSHGRWRCPEPGCGVLLGANAVQAPVTMCKSSWAAVASCFLRELRVPSLPVG